MVDLEVLNQIFSDIRQSGLFPLGWVASVDATGAPHVRTVKILGFNWAQKLFHFTCNRHHEKLEHFAAKPVAELCLVAPEKGMQLRFACRVEVVGPESESTLRQRFWERTSPKSRVQLYKTHPRQEKPPLSFVLVTLSALQADLLDLGCEEARRLFFSDFTGPASPKSI